MPTKTGNKSRVSSQTVITQKQAVLIMKNARLFTRKSPVRAVLLKSKILINSRNGVIETGRRGDYLVQSIRRPLDFWIVRKEVFEAEFELS
jgi:hypothetical protein